MKVLICFGMHLKKSMELAIETFRNTRWRIQSCIEDHFQALDFCYRDERNSPIYRALCLKPSAIFSGQRNRQPDRRPLIERDGSIAADRWQHGNSPDRKRKPVAGWQWQVAY
jgi:hypothetical protein